ncbi:MAG: RNA methyltransferase [Saprospiraceae bacterium]|nr:MAG: RNA methyltransferase [Saprospiraceae bacterium]GIV32326.1 MAG: RNA methyltransferase [Saprospiraceae bacterium]
MALFQELSQNKLRYLRSLRSERMRQKYHNFIVEGVKIADEVLRHPQAEVELIVAVPEWIEANRHLLDSLSGKVYVASQKVLSQISLLTTPNMVLCVLKRPQVELQVEWLHTGITLYLDGVQDPGNLGTILRTADWFGVRQVVAGPGTVDPFNSKVLQAAMGSFLRVRVLHMALDSLHALAPRVPIFGAVLDGQDVATVNLPRPAILAMGNESRGLTDQSLRHLHERIRIAAADDHGAESLNVAVATGILLALWHYRSS